MEKNNRNKWENPTGTPTYNSWKSMRNRVLNNNACHKGYKEKGIKICQEWDSYDKFFLDMGERKERTTLDRINPSGDYTPMNCRWATMRVQQNNKNGLTKIEKDGVSLTIGEWCHRLGLSESEMNRSYKRHSKYGALTYDEIFCTHLLSFRKSLEVNTCIVCGTNSSKKWRSNSCVNCYARAMRYFKKVGKKIDIAGYATLVANLCDD